MLRCARYAGCSRSLSWRSSAVIRLMFLHGLAQPAPHRFEVSGGGDPHDLLTNVGVAMSQPVPHLNQLAQFWQPDQLAIGGRHGLDGVGHVDDAHLGR